MLIKLNDMKITTRKTWSFIEIKVDTNEVTLFKSDDRDKILDMIQELRDVISDLEDYIKNE